MPPLLTCQRSRAYRRSAAGLLALASGPLVRAARQRRESRAPYGGWARGTSALEGLPAKVVVHLGGRPVPGRNRAMTLSYPHIGTD